MAALLSLLAAATLTTTAATCIGGVFKLDDGARASAAAAAFVDEATTLGKTAVYRDAGADSVTAALAAYDLVQSEGCAVVVADERRAAHAKVLEQPKAVGDKSVDNVAAHVTRSRRQTVPSH